MEGIRSKYKKFAFTEAKTAKDRANIVRTKKSIERMNKLDKAKAKRKEGIKASKEIKKMIGTGQADRVGGSVYHRGVREKKFIGGIIGKGKKKKKEENESKKGTKPKDLIYKPSKMERLKELRKELKAKGGRIGFNKGGDLGMQSVKYGLDNNPKVTAADPKAKFIAANKKSKKKVI
jgi:hypothetical protein